MAPKAMMAPPPPCFNLPPDLDNCQMIWTNDLGSCWAYEVGEDGSVASSHSDITFPAGTIFSELRFIKELFYTFDALSPKQADGKKYRVKLGTYNFPFMDDSVEAKEYASSYGGYIYRVKPQ